MSEDANSEIQLVYVALGSNLGDREKFLNLGLEALEQLPDTRLIHATAVEETLPVGNQAQPLYLNRMALLETSLGAREILRCGNEAERAAGRVRRERWEARTLDIDIVRYGELTSDDTRLALPHPELKNRTFWLREMAELAARVQENGLPSWAQVSSKRLEHIERVAALVETWAVAMGVPAVERKRWLRAVWLHDAVRDAPPSFTSRWSLEGWDEPHLDHGPAAAALAQNEGETDEGILNAVRFHTVGFKDWDLVGKILYMADYLELGRTYFSDRELELLGRVPNETDRVFREVVLERKTWMEDSGLKPTAETGELWGALEIKN
ncbi:MAG: 2-amino-4-hydroxy-6-hydroxymethyldihydropteridine diphosphokinase [Gemmatimonadota bacterium]|nr:2-amino-4-hydroxy-6-hydroxymethyldihydropteridine diphosphokinase [Gemmatimonadota bacterium]MDH5803884.1 2-amino-4-hydroxy-6-hydroxymethyldihydropteridine diphosphokinase [Gemmatimonadota bacterium]